jgi:hypothetical protein
VNIVMCQRQTLTNGDMGRAAARAGDVVWVVSLIAGPSGGP